MRVCTDHPCIESPGGNSRTVKAVARGGIQRKLPATGAAAEAELIGSEEIAFADEQK